MKLGFSVLAATLSEFGSQVGGGKDSATEGGSQTLTEAQKNIIKSIAEEDLAQLQKLIDKWANKYKATRFFGFGAQDFVDSFKKIREQLNLKLNSLTTSMTITIQTKMMDFQLAVIDNLEEIADKIDQVAEKQEAALKHIQAMGGGASVNTFKGGMKDVEKMIEQVERTVMSGDASTRELIVDSLGEMDAKLTKVMNSTADKIRFSA